MHSFGPAQQGAGARENLAAGKLRQLRLLDAAKLPVAGVETARKLADPGVPSNGLIQRAKVGRGA